MAFYCEDPEMFCSLQKFPWLSIGINLSRYRLKFPFQLNCSFKQFLLKKLLKIIWLQLLNCEYLFGFVIFYDGTLNIFGFVTVGRPKQGIIGNVGDFQYFFTFL